MVEEEIRWYKKDEKEAINEKTGEIVNTKDIKNFIDDDKVEEYKKLMGYYLIVSSELEMSPTEIIEKYHNLTKIENEFRILKSTLNTRPMFVRKREHIYAHITICFIALLIFNIIQKRVLEYAKNNNINLSLNKNIKPTNKWEIGMSDDRIQEALNKFQIESLNDQLYRMVNIKDKDLDVILKALNLNIEHKIYTKMDVLKLKKEINPF